jgi:hypothetical protein
MSRNESVDHALGRVRRARARLAPTAAKVKPLAGKAGAATARRVRRTRAWAAPQVKRAGEVLQDSVAPKVSAMMSSAAERIDPEQPRRGRRSGSAGIARLKRAASAAKAASARLRGGTRRTAEASAGDAAETVATDTVAPSADESS